MTPVDLIEIAGSLLILSAFAAAQAGRLTPQSRSYLGLNIVGSAVLAVIALLDRSWGFLLLEGCWALVSAAGLIKVVREDRRNPRREAPPADTVTSSAPPATDPTPRDHP